MLVKLFIDILIICAIYWGIKHWRKLMAKFNGVGTSSPRQESRQSAGRSRRNNRKETEAEEAINDNETEYVDFVEIKDKDAGRGSK